MGEMVYAGSGKMFFKIRQKDFRNADRSCAYWTKKIFHCTMGECFENFNGGCLPCYLADVVATAICPSEELFIETHRKEIYSYLIDKKSKFGWLSPTGDFYPCAYTNHQELAELYFGKQELQMEKEHWVKVFKEFDSSEPVYAHICPNHIQLEWLQDHNVKYSKYASYQ